MRIAMSFRTTMVGTLATLLLMTVRAATSTTTTITSTAQFFLPSRSTPLGYHIYATPITSDASTTQYLLACQTQFDTSSYSCGGDFTGLTLTYGPSSMHLNLGPSVGLDYDCALSPAVCTVTSSGIVATSTVLSLAAAETSKSITAVMILDDGRKRGTQSLTVGTTSAATTTTSSGGSDGTVCKRKTASTTKATTTTRSKCEESWSTGGNVEIGMVIGVTALVVLVGMVVL